MTTRKFVCKYNDGSFETRVCEALGLDPTMVSRIIIDLQAQHAAVVYITMFADKQTISEIEFNGNDFLIVERENDGKRQIQT